MSQREDGALEKIFKANINKPWVFIKQGGNQGDQMIYRGAEKLADLCKLQYKTIELLRASKKEPQIKKGDIIYLHGGGGFNTWWNWTPRLLNKLRQLYPKNYIIVGPSTMALQKWYLDKWVPVDDRTIFYAREQTTYNYLKENHYPTIRIDHDTALHLTRDDEYLKPLLGVDNIKNKHKLAAIREDPESPDTLPSSVNLDDYDIVVDPCSKENWGELHAHASEILTNRSHSAILGGILGKPTKIFAGKYHKNLSMWGYSMKQLGVKWIE